MTYKLWNEFSGGILKKDLFSKLQSGMELMIQSGLFEEIWDWAAESPPQKKWKLDEKSIMIH